MSGTQNNEAARASKQSSNDANSRVSSAQGTSAGLFDEPIEMLSIALECDQPVLIKGLVKHWPFTQVSQASPNKAIEYLKGLYNGKSILACKGKSEDKGRFFYDEQVTTLNYETIRMQVDDVLDAIALSFTDDSADNFYIPSTPASHHFNGFMDDNFIDIPIKEQGGGTQRQIIPNLWIGGKTIASCHYDIHKNIACCTTGRRRFTVFPPEQVQNLYPGPFEKTPGGPVISMVDFKAPDLERFPRFAEAQKHGREFVLEPGDALYVPPLWWHHVEGLDDLNILVNYWWDESPRYLGSPANAMHHAMLSIRDRPESEKQAWKAMFEYYVFSSASESNQHLPEHAQGILAELDETSARRLRALVIDRLNR